MKRIIGLLLVIVVMFSIVACGSGSNNADEAWNTEYKADYATEDATMEMDDAAMDVGGLQNRMEASEEESAPASSTGNTQVVESTRKIIKSASMEIQTLEYELAVQRLTDKVKGIGGYVESSNVRGRAVDDHYSTRSAHYTLRIPEKQFLQFMSDMNSIGTIIQENSYGEDITAQYFDTEAHMKTLKIQEERLLDILMKAEKIEDVITLERELSNIRYQIEALTGNLKRWDNLVSYSTLSISIYEVQEIIKVEEPAKTLGEKIAQRFNHSLENIKEFFEDLTIFLLGSLPLLIIYLPIMLVLFLIGRKVYRILVPKVTYVESEEEDKK